MKSRNAPIAKGFSGAPLWLLTPLVLLVAGSWSAWNTHNDYQHVIEQEYRLLEVHARQREASISGAFRSVSLMLDNIQDDLREQPSMPAPKLNQLLVQSLRQLPEIRNLLLTDAEGRVTASNNEKLIGFDASKREYFMAHLSSPEKEGIHVSRPFRTVTGIMGTTLSRPLRDRSGQFAGVLVATLDASYFDEAIKFRVDAPTSQALLINLHGDVLNAAPTSSFIGKNLQGGIAFTEHMASRQATTRHLNTTKLERIERMSVFHNIPGAPLAIIVSRNKDSVIADWRLSLYDHIASFLLLATATFFFYWLAARRQASLAQAQAFSAQLIETANVMVVGLDDSGKVRIFNKAAEEISGYGREDVLGQPWFELIAPRERYPEVWDEFQRIQGAGEFMAAFENPILTRSGDERIISWQNSVLTSNEDGVTIVSFGVDITERKRSQQRLEYVLAEQKAILENDLIGIVTVMNRHIVWANPAFEKLLGYDPGELAGSPTRQNYPSEEAFLAFGAAAYPVLASGKVFRHQIEHVRKDGRHIWVDVSGSIMDSESGESLWGFVDITEQRLLEQTTAINQQRMELALNGADLGLWDLDIATGEFTHNTRLVTMFGFQPGEVAITRDEFLARLHPDDLPRLRDRFMAHLKNESPDFDIEYRARHKDDHWFWVLSRGKVVERDKNGFALRMTGTNLDISERKTSEALLKMREARLSSLIASMQDTVMVLDTGGTVIEHFHPAGSQNTASPQPAALLGKTYDEAFPADVANRFMEAITGIIMDGDPRNFEYSLSIDGREYLSQATMSPLASESRYPTGFLAVIRDITIERATQNELERLARTNALLLESVGSGIYGVDLNYRTTFVNPAALSMLGFTEMEMLEQEQHGLIHHHRQNGASYPADDCPIKLTLNDGQIRHDENEWFWRKDGSGFPVSLIVTPVIENGNRVGVVVIFQDITARKASEAEIHDMAFYDPLTRLPNRRLLIDRLTHALPASARRQTHGAVVFLDLDNFKALNDARGHECGDLLLIEAAKRLLSCVRTEDTVARLGGDEFVVLLEELGADPMEARARALAIGDKICVALGMPYSLQTHRHQSTASVGICLFMGLDIPTDELLRRADAAMYQAKAAGRNTVRLFENEALPG